MKPILRILSLPVAALVFAVSAQTAALGEELAVFAPMASSYRIGGFTFTPPSGDGWRQVTSSTDTFRIVYAEKLGESAINTRVEVVAQALPIPDPALVTDVVALAQESQKQQAAERGERLVAFSRVAPLPGTEGMQSYSLVTQLGEQELHEIFFVSLASDKSEYFVAKVATQEADYVKAPYFDPLRESMASLKYVAAPAQPTAPVPEATLAVPVPDKPE